MAVELGKITINETALYELDSNPALGSGFTANVGDQAIDTSTGVQYSKIGAGVNNWAPALVVTFETTATTLNGTKTLTVGSARLQVLTGTATGYSVVLPSALTMIKGEKFEIVNQSSQNVTIKTNGGATLFTLSQTSIGFITLQDASTAAGVWIFWQVFVSSLASGILNYTIVSSTAFVTSSTTDVAITSYTTTPQAGTYSVWHNCSAITSGNNRTVTQTIYKAGVAISDSIRATTIPNSGENYIHTTMTVAAFNGAETCDVRVKISASTLTVNQRTLILIRLG